MTQNVLDQSYKTDELINRDINAYLEKYQKKSSMRFITCGSVGDGKSTLIGRLLHDSKKIFEDQLQLGSDSKRQARKIKRSTLLFGDGLVVEREQGTTIDVKYRFFDTESKFIVADVWP